MEVDNETEVRGSCWDVRSDEDGVTRARLDGKFGDGEARLGGYWFAVAGHAADFGSWREVFGILSMSVDGVI